MKLEVKDLTFYYPGRKERPVLEHFDLEILPGSGSGSRARADVEKQRCAR